jgi:cyclic beta-1,2-glucan synthetase
VKAPRVVVEGYGLLQPRVTAALPLENASRYERLCRRRAGHRPVHAHRVRRLPGLFGEGSFIGKGIYDLDVFERVLGERLPDNQVLSHDLLEGCYLRAPAC